MTHHRDAPEWQSTVEGKKQVNPSSTLLNSTRDEKVVKNRMEEILVSNSGLVSGLSEASGVKFSWVEVSQESLKMVRKQKTGKSAYQVPLRGDGEGKF